MRYFKTDRFIVSYSLARRNVNAFLQLQPGTKSNTHRLKRNYRDQLFSFDNSIAASRWQYSTILKETALTTLLFIISIKHFISHQNTLYPQVLKFTILSITIQRYLMFTFPLSFYVGGEIKARYVQVYG